MARKAPGSAKERRTRRKANAKARGKARESANAPVSRLEKGLGAFQALEPLTLLSKVGRRGPVAATLGAAGILAFAGLRSLRTQRVQGDLETEALGLAPGLERTPTDIARDSASVLSNERLRTARRSELVAFETRGIRGATQQQAAARLFQEKMFQARLSRMKQVAKNDPELFKQLTAMVVGSSRPHTTGRTERIGPQPSITDLVDSGLFDGSPL